MAHKILEKNGEYRAGDSAEKTLTGSGLVRGEECLKVIFPNADDRPSLRWLSRLRAKRLVPAKKIGRLTFYSPEEVRRAIDRNFSIHAIGE